MEPGRGIRIEGLKKRYGSGDTAVDALKGIDLQVAPGEVVGLVGPSGSGKSTLLKCLGAVIDPTAGRMVLGDEVIYDNGWQVKDLRALRRDKIGFVFQAPYLIPFLDVTDNVALLPMLAGVANQEARARAHELLTALEVQHRISAMPSQLSGGEQQRVAIACAMAKNPDLIIADEPTSALDQHNAELIMRIFRKSAHERGKKVVIATHNKNICQSVDSVYEISNRQIVRRNGANTAKTVAAQEGCAAHEEVAATRVPGFRPFATKPVSRKLGFPFFFNYARRSSRKMRFQRSLMLTLCAIAIAFTVTAGLIGNSFIAAQNDLMKQISDREIFVVNLTAPGELVVDYDENLSIPAEKLQSIANIDHIETIEPYFEFRSTGFLADRAEAYSSATLTLHFSDASQTFVFENDDRQLGNLIIVPYYPEQKLDRQVAVTVSSNNSQNIYLSHQLANRLGISEQGDEPAIDVTIGVPVRTTVIEMTVNSRHGDFSQGAAYSGDIDCSILQNLHLPIAGVLNAGVTNPFTSQGNNIIYVPIDRMKEFLSSARDEYDRRQPADSSDLVTSAWQPSAYVIYAQSYNDIGSIMRKISSIDSNLVSKSNYQDVEAMNLMVANIKTTITWISIIVLIVFVVLMIIIFTNHVLSRKFEAAVLRANGLTQAEMIKLIMSESLLNILTAFFISVVVSVTLTFFINKLFSFTLITFSWLTAVMLLAITILAIIGPTLASAIAMNRFKPDQVFRN